MNPLKVRGITHRRYLAILAVAFLIFWTALAIKPWYRHDWLLENALVILFVVLIALFHRRWIFSRLSYTLIFIFLCFHTIGAHYTYARTPYDEWFVSVFERSLNAMLGWERNNYDRVVHFLYGLLFAYPVREIFLRVARVRGFWGYFLPLDLMMSSSACFELVEWLVAELFGGDLGAAYLGTQGDIWDAHKDMALASLGALVAMTITAVVNAYLRRDFAREWSDSLRIKGSHPLGEDEVARLWRRRQLTPGAGTVGRSRTPIKRLSIIVGGSLTLIVGVVMIFTPGPALILIPAGLAMLATEVPWAQSALVQMRRWIERRRETKANPED